MKDIQKIIEECKEKISLLFILGIVYPKSHLSKTRMPAFNFGGVRGILSVIAVSEDLINLLDEEELKFIIYHEISHVKNNDLPDEQTGSR